MKVRRKKSMMTIGSLCSGIGGLELGLERAGLGTTVWQVEQDPYCNEVLAKWWPRADRSQRDVKNAKALQKVDIVCAGFPCQPVSVAGKRKGTNDERWLWPHIERIIKEVTPRIVVIENVPGLRSAGLRDVLASLANLGFDAEWETFGAWHIGAPHVRKRIFIAATHPDRIELRNEPGWLRGTIRSETAPLPRSFVERISTTYTERVSGSGVVRRRDSKTGGTFTRLETTYADSLRRLEQARELAILRLAVSSF